MSENNVLELSLDHHGRSRETELENPSWTIFALDVRSSGGGEPFAAIMMAVRQLRPDRCLRLYTTFKPDPLFTVMAAKGFTNTVTAMDGGDWMVVFTPACVLKQEVEEIEAGAPDTWPEPSYFLDCTDPVGPEAQVRVLRRLAAMTPG